jgi:alpha-ketoglutarate-dependent taurine dioxygenase
MGCAATTTLPAIIRADAAAHRPADSLASWIREHRARLLARLAAEGALLFRGFGVATAADFQTCCEGLVDRLIGYEGGGAPRTALGGNVYTSTEHPATEPIPLHIEASYLRRMPRFVFFFCATPPEHDGQTPLGDMRAVLQRIKPEVRDKFIESGVRYICNMHGGAGAGKSWQETFATDDRGAAERFLIADGYDFAWKADGGLRTAITAPATSQHPVTGAEFWCNQAVNWHSSQFDRLTLRAVRRRYGEDDNLPKHSTYGDGRPIADEDCAHIRAVLRENEQIFEWQTGDVLACDNRMVGHGRQSFRGRRRILVAMA